MKLDDYLKDTGTSKAELSRLLGVTRGAIQKWDNIPARWMTVLFPDDDRKAGIDYTLDEIRALCKMRAVKPDDEIARSAGLALHEFQGMIERLRQEGLKRGYKQVEEMKSAGNWPPACP